jgi:hypothetical protein
MYAYLRMPVESKRIGIHETCPPGYDTREMPARGSRAVAYKICTRVAQVKKAANTRAKKATQTRKGPKSGFKMAGLLNALEEAAQNVAVNNENVNLPSIKRSRGRTVKKLKQRMSAIQYHIQQRDKRMRNAIQKIRNRAVQAEKLAGQAQHTAKEVAVAAAAAVSNNNLRPARTGPGGGGEGGYTRGRTLKRNTMHTRSLSRSSNRGNVKGNTYNYNNTKLVSNSNKHKSVYENKVVGPVQKYNNNNNNNLRRALANLDL